jgi:hypothetical protein
MKRFAAQNLAKMSVYFCAPVGTGREVVLTAFSMPNHRLTRFGGAFSGPPLIDFLLWPTI